MSIAGHNLFSLLSLYLLNLTKHVLSKLPCKIQKTNYFLIKVSQHSSYKNIIFVLVWGQFITEDTIEFHQYE